MKTSDFNFTLPPELVAQEPPVERDGGKLMLLNCAAQKWESHAMHDLPSVVRACFPERQPLIVFNNSRVRKARVYGIQAGFAVPLQFLLINTLDNGLVWKALVKNARRRRPGERYSMGSLESGNTLQAEVVEKPASGQDGFVYLRFEKPIDDAWLDQVGHVPLPPYIKRPDNQADGERYQTVYAEETGSVAAPTAGLHFTPAIIEQLRAQGCDTVFVTLHVGLGTFLPVRTDNVEEHHMHEELYRIESDVAQAVTKAKREGRPVLAVGTTSVRTLESAWDSSRQELPAGEDTTRIFIYPGFKWQVVDALFTNFHTPESTLLMLVSSFAGTKIEAAGGEPASSMAGRDLMLRAYQAAITQGYHFFSYGDAMLMV
jgi:S-adenosylmethionine:tRNA ribosyltransferase-isomerase